MLIFHSFSCNMQFPKDDFRVIFVNAYSDIARVVMCEVGVVIVVLICDVAYLLTTEMV